MAYAHIFVIPDQGNMKGGDLYDRYGNLEYFADVDGLADKTKTGVDTEQSVKAHSISPYMRSKGQISVKAHPRYASTQIRLTKGAVPGYTVTLQDSVEKRKFQWTGTMSALYAYLKANAAVEMTLYGKTGTPYQSIPVSSEALAKRKIAQAA